MKVIVEVEKDAGFSVEKDVKVLIGSEESILGLLQNLTASRWKITSIKEFEYV